MVFYTITCPIKRKGQHVAGRDVQGLLGLSKRYRAARWGTADQKLLYVEFMEAAPWNHWRRSDRVFAGIGTIFMTELVEFSILAGFEGRVGLHALPSADRFYTELGMNRSDPEGRDEMRYFEFTPNAAQSWHRSVGS